MIDPSIGICGHWFIHSLYSSSLNLIFYLAWKRESALDPKRVRKRPRRVIYYCQSSYLAIRDATIRKAIQKEVVANLWRGICLYFYYIFTFSVRLVHIKNYLNVHFSINKQTPPYSRKSNKLFLLWLNKTFFILKDKSKVYIWTQLTNVNTI